ncbi:MAG: TerD family protein [Clostridia bacterium]|nr:TerD family protein [Clostridia bacterium]
MAVELKKGQKVNLKKKVPIGEILINLNWDQPKKRFLFAPKPIDLDLGCLYELKNGRKGTVQALGNAFGHLNAEPWIALDGDDRTGASAAGENLRINGAKIPEIKRVLVYTFIYEGAANWQTANGVVTLRYPGNEDIIVRMDAYNNARRMCAIALLENDGGDGFSVEKQVSFFDGHAQMDKAYGWGMRWVPGRK